MPGARWCRFMAATMPRQGNGWQMTSVIAAHGHLGERDQARAIVARFAAQGRVNGYFAAAAREPYRAPEPKTWLSAGIRLVLA